jgi:hypothetical protein
VGSGNQQPEEEELRLLRREMEVLRQERAILKKALAIFSRPEIDRFLFIEHHREHFEVRIICRVLGVSVGGFYAVAKAPEKLQGAGRWRVDPRRLWKSSRLIEESMEVPAFMRHWLARAFASDANGW